MIFFSFHLYLLISLLLPVIMYFASSLEVPNKELRYIAGTHRNEIIIACADIYLSKKNLPDLSKLDLYNASKIVIFAS